MRPVYSLYVKSASTLCLCLCVSVCFCVFLSVSVCFCVFLCAYPAGRENFKIGNISKYVGTTVACVLRCLFNASGLFIIREPEPLLLPRTLAAAQGPYTLLLPRTPAAAQRP